MKKKVKRYTGILEIDWEGVSSFYEGPLYQCEESPWPSDIAEFYADKLNSLRSDHSEPAKAG